MALVTNSLLQGLRGKVGNQVYKQRRGKTYVEALPVYNKDRIPTKNELDARANFKKSVAYARKAMADPKLEKIYKKSAYRKKTAYSIAFRHATQSPNIKWINTAIYTGLPNSKVFISVTDEVKVEEVLVRIVTADGVLIEEGSAYLPDGKNYNWTYVAMQYNTELEGCTVIVVAKNLPGNEGILEKTIFIHDLDGE
jgi:hypothetical protein